MFVYQLKSKESKECFENGLSFKSVVIRDSVFQLCVQRVGLRDEGDGDEPDGIRTTRSHQRSKFFLSLFRSLGLKTINFVQDHEVAFGKVRSTDGIGVQKGERPNVQLPWYW